MASELWARSGGKRTLVGLKDGKEGVGGGGGMGINLWEVVDRMAIGVPVYYIS